MKIDNTLKPRDLLQPLARLFELAAQKIVMLDRSWGPTRGAPVFTIAGKYTARGWTEWTEGFMYGLPLLAFDATGNDELLQLGRRRTAERMATHVTHRGVHDHGFNTISTYGNLRRLMREGRIPHDPWELACYELAIKASACTQASRWSTTHDGSGYVYSFNGPHSLFIDTMRTLRVLGLAHQLGHVFMGENDVKISLLSRLINHGLTTAQYNIYYGEGRDHYDTPRLSGRTVHEAVFNTNDGRFRCPSSQQGYSPFSTWTRGLAWAMLGFSEELEFLHAIAAQSEPSISAEVRAQFEAAATTTCNFYLTQAAAADGVCYWDTGAPGMVHLANFHDKPADPFNEHEPVDASASAIAAQGLLRLGHYLGKRGTRYTSAGLTIARTLLAEPYLSTAPKHQGLLLHSVYHRPNGWDYIPKGQRVPCGESSMWGDYHLLELAVYVQRLAAGTPYLCYFDADPNHKENRS
jgi:unsaturated chondroitin disaccharide hydrolase